MENDVSKTKGLYFYDHFTSLSAGVISEKQKKGKKNILKISIRKLVDVVIFFLILENVNYSLGLESRK